MNNRFFSSFVVAVAVLVPALAVDAAPAPKVTERITCTDFITLDDQFKPQAISYVIGFDKAKHPDRETIDVTGMEKIVPVVTESCKAKPEETLAQRIHALWDKL